MTSSRRASKPQKRIGEILFKKCDSPQTEHCLRLAMPRRFAVPLFSLGNILRNSNAPEVVPTHREYRVTITVARDFGIQGKRSFQILRYPVAMKVIERLVVSSDLFVCSHSVASNWSSIFSLHF